MLHRHVGTHSNKSGAMHSAVSRRAEPRPRTARARACHLPLNLSLSAWTLLTSHMCHAAQLRPLSHRGGRTWDPGARGSTRRETLGSRLGLLWTLGGTRDRILAALAQLKTCVSFYDCFRAMFFIHRVLRRVSLPLRKRKRSRSNRLYLSQMLKAHVSFD